MWLRHSSGGYINTEQCFLITAELDDTTWYINAYYNPAGNGKVQLNGSWSTQADAEEVLRELVDGALQPGRRVVDV